jgi:3-oxoacyl-[acyl-carrier-protein] synthase III
MSRTRAAITSVGCYVPDRVVTNHDLAKIVNTSDEWIRTRTGIVERRYAEPGTPTSDLAARAARACLERRGVSAAELDLIIVATITPDTIFPSTACVLQHKLGASRAWGFDISAACSGFLYALTTGAQFVESGAHRKVLVVGADVMTSILDMQDRKTCVLFGDGAGAVLLEPSPDGTGILSFHHEVDGSGGPFLCMPAGGSAMPPTAETLERKLHYIKQDGAHVFKFAVKKLADLSHRFLVEQGLAEGAIDLFVAHQANVRIIDAAAHRLGLPEAKVLKNIHMYGNTTAATIPLALGTALDEGRLKPNDLVLFAAVGAGFTVGAALARWTAVRWP